MDGTMLVVAAATAAGLLYWFPVRGWYRRAEARRVQPLRAMSGDADLLCPDHESTLTIGIDAGSSEVWPCLLQMGRGPRSQQTTKELSQLRRGDAIQVSFAPAFPIVAIDPGRTLVLGNEGTLQWRWQFELYPTHVGRTRLISRARLRAGRTFGSSFLALVLQPVSFVIMRKMLLDVKRRAERLAAESRRATPSSLPVAP